MCSKVKLMLVLLAVSLFGSTFCYGDTIPLQVEACLVEVPTAVIYGKGGVKKLDSIPMLKVLWALRDGGGGKIVNCMKIAVLSGQEGSVASNSENSEEVASDNEKADEKISTEVNVSAGFEAFAEMMKSDRIAIKFNYKYVVEEQEDINSASSDKGEQIETEAQVDYSWSGGTVIEAGKCVIAGLTQDKKKVVFLIIRADFVK